MSGDVLIVTALPEELGVIFVLESVLRISRTGVVFCKITTFFEGR